METHLPCHVLLEQLWRIIAFAYGWTMHKKDYFEHNDDLNGCEIIANLWFLPLQSKYYNNVVQALQGV